jgi:HNH endonuclease
MLPALEAAHIRPYSDGGAHEARNGLLLRRDIHSLFDLGYVTVTPELRFEVSRRIREEYDNGRQYHAMHGKQIEPPKNVALRPDPAASPGIMTTASRGDRFYQIAQVWFERRCRATSLLEIAT